MTLFKTFFYIITFIILITIGYIVISSVSTYYENKNLEAIKQLEADTLPRKVVVEQSQEVFNDFTTFLDTTPTTVSLETAGNVNNETLSTLRKDILKQIDILNERFNPYNEDEVELPLDFYVMGAAEIYFNDKKAKVEGLLEKYNIELDAEKARIAETARIAAEQAAAEEAARIAEEQAYQARQARISSQRQINVEDVNTSNESVEVRIARLKAETNVSIPVYLQDACGSAPSTPGYYIIACYQPTLHYISITQAGYNLSDSSVKCSLLHENRHYWQDVNGYIQVDSSGNILNREWLESDAKANSCAT